jgi:hypothetical protein
MGYSNQQRLLGAVRACLVPFARILIRAGISFRQFSEMAKAAFVDQTLAENDYRGRATNISRIAVRTGLSRKEIARILRRSTDKTVESEQAEAATYHFHQAARVLQLWHSDSRFVGDDGLPKDLALEGAADTFASLVRSAGGDVPPGAVRAELLAAGAVSEVAGGHLRALKRDYVPEDIGEELIVGLTLVVYPTIAGVAHNVEKHGLQTFMQRVAFSNRLVPAAVPLFRQVARKRSTDFVQAVDDWLSSNEIEPEQPTEQGDYVAVGVFYFEGLLPDINEPDRHLLKRA